MTGFGPATSCSICCVSALLVGMTVTLVARGPPPACAFGASARAPAHHGKPEACPPLSTGLLSTFPDQVRIGEATRAEDTGAVALTETRRRGTSSGAAPTPRGKISVEPARRGDELVARSSLTLSRHESQTRWTCLFQKPSRRVEVAVR